MRKPEDNEYEYIFRMTIRRNGRVIRRPDGRPFLLRVRRQKR